MNTGNITAMAKRGYSRAFTPQTERRVRFEVDRIPPTLFDAVKAKAKKQGISLRALTLTLWTEWVKHDG
jgi:predicted HicB family RNase H-like nuclease